MVSKVFYNSSIEYIYFIVTDIVAGYPIVTHIHKEIHTHACTHTDTHTLT